MTPGTRSAPSLVIGAAFGAAAIALLLLLGMAVDRWTFGFDAAIVRGLRAWGGPAWLPRAAIELTSLGGGAVLTLVVLLVAGLLAVAQRRGIALATIAACWSGGLVVEIVKPYVARARPTLVPHLIAVNNYSFPSGHSADSACVYLTLAALGSQAAPDAATRRYLIGAAILLVGLIGASRVYLGVHWPSDVAAGWSFGTLWALGWWHATAALRRVSGVR